MTEASFYIKLEENKVKCELCPRNCVIESGKYGNCNARRNRSGLLISEVFGKISVLNFDPIEKKPLYHFYPGSEILSIGTTGCNLHCIFCQNFSISQCDGVQHVDISNYSPIEIELKSLKTKRNIGVAFTYNEPIVNFEFVLETSTLVKRNSQKTVLVSNGYINQKPLNQFIDVIDAFNIDLKGFSTNFYQKYTKATLEPVKQSIKSIAQSGKHLELTNLIIPSINDDETEFEEMCKWIAGEIGEETVLHLSKYFPRYKLDQYPTPPETLFELFDIAKNYLKYVYLGNIATEIHSNTYCPSCGKLMIERTYYNIKLKDVDETGKCKSCGKQLFKYF
jgi:pyruvate formate lyase activating enzyme